MLCHRHDGRIKMNKEKKTIRELIIRKRKELDFTQIDLAKKTGLTPSQISNFESGKTTLRSDTLDKIFDVLNFPKKYEIELEIMKPSRRVLSNYSFFINDVDCCSHVNRSRYPIELRGEVIGGKVRSSRCSWCGKHVDMPEVVKEDELYLCIVSSKTEEKGLFLFEDKIYLGYQGGQKRKVFESIEDLENSSPELIDRLLESL